jgi:DNA polymerase-3 subunit beta
MKVSTSRAALFTELQTVTRAASTRSAVQALSGVQLQASGGAIELRATDMEIGLRVPLEGEIVRDGAVVLPARLLVDVVRALPGDSGRRATPAPRRDPRNWALRSRAPSPLPS